MKISRKCNTIIDYQKGDGFRSIILCDLTLPLDSLVVTTKPMVDFFLKRKQSVSVVLLN